MIDELYVTDFMLRL